MQTIRDGLNFAVEIPYIKITLWLCKYTTPKHEHGVKRRRHQLAEGPVRPVCAIEIANCLLYNKVYNIVKYDKYCEIW